MIVIYRDTQNILIATNESTSILFVKQVLSLEPKENIDSYMFFWCNCSLISNLWNTNIPIKYCRYGFIWSPVGWLKSRNEGCNLSIGLEIVLA